MMDMQPPIATIVIDGLDEIINVFNKRVERIIKTLSKTEKESRLSLSGEVVAGSGNPLYNVLLF